MNGRNTNTQPVSSSNNATPPNNGSVFQNSFGFSDSIRQRL